MLDALGMKTLAVLSLGGMFWAAAGCTDSTGDVSGASDLDSKAPVADVSDNQGQDASQASGSDDQVSTFDGDAAQTFEDVTARHCDSHNRMANNVPVAVVSEEEPLVDALEFAIVAFVSM